MIAKKCFLIMRRLIDLGPKNTTLLLYYRIRRVRFLARRVCTKNSTSAIKRDASYILFDAMFHDPFWRSAWPSLYHDTQEIYQKADATVARKFTILGFGTFKLASPLPWQSDFISPPLKEIKVPWELSRFDYLFVLGLAYQQAQKEHDHDRALSYVDSFMSLITEWIVLNPCYNGVNWQCPMEVAIRVINWVWGGYFFHNDPTISEYFWEQFTIALIHHADYLYYTWEFSDRPNNHYLSDLVGFVYVSTFLCDIKRCDRVVKRLLKQINHQIHPDGSCYEGSTAYHRLDTELVLLTILLLKHTGREIPVWLHERYARMQQFFANCCPTPETIVLIGDNDSGKIMSGLIPTSHVNGPICHDHGKAGNFSADGFGVSIIKTHHWHITFRHATYHARQPTGHFHNDQLAITLFDDGDPVFIDPGTISYTGDPQMRNALRSIAYHNTFYIDGYEPENTRLSNIDLFVLPRRKHSMAPEGIETESSIFIRDYHQGYLFFGLTAQRTVEVLKENHECVITDRWLGKNFSGLYTSWAFVLSPQVTIEKMNENTWAIGIRDQKRLIFESSLAFVVGQTSCSLVYGQAMPCYMLKASMMSDDKEHIMRIKRFDAV